jgi:hypothetical protein
MPVSSGKFSAPIDLGRDIAGFFGIDSGDLGYLITNAPINKWALYKPIRYNKVGFLTRDEFIGMQTDVNQGVYFGLQLVSSGQISEETLTWPLLHGAIWTYLKPRGKDTNSEWFRATDFCDMQTAGRGYNHNAVPNPSGQFNNVGAGNLITGYYNIDRGITSINAYYLTTNNDGVDLSMILKTPSTTIDYTLARTFPCAIVTDSNNNSYFTALFYEDDDTPRPMYYNGAYLGGTWYLRFNKPAFTQSPQPGTPPWNSSQNNMKITLFMLYCDYISNGIPYLDAMHTQSLKDYWYDCTLDILGQKEPIPFPNGTNFNLQLRPYSATGTTATATGVRGSTNGFTIRYKFDNAYEGSFTVRTDVGLGQGAYGTDSLLRANPEFTYNSRAFTFDELGIVPVSGQVLQIPVTMTTTIGSASTVTTATLTYTIP